MRTWAGAIGAVAALTAGCFEPTYPAGLICSERRTCPPGQMCGADGVCASVGGEIDASDVDASSPDAGATDASDLDASDLDASDVDAGDPDATSPPDASPPDASPPDAVPPDASPPDAPPPTCSLVPTMTGPDSPSGHVTRSSIIDPPYEGWRAFDGATSTLWISAIGQAPAWLAYEWTDGPRTALRYAITFTNGDLETRAPRDWTLQGWNGSSWVTVDTRSGVGPWLGSEIREFAVASPGSYSGYRLHVTDDNDPSAGIVVISITSLELFGPACP
jgi:hypothetical protein